MKKAGPLDVGPLIVAIERMVRTAPAAHGALIELAKKHDDPRVASALHRLVRSPPYARTDGRLYGRVITALEQLGDPRYLPDIVTWSAELEPRRRFIRRERADLDVLRDAAARLARKPAYVAPQWLEAALSAAAAPKPRVAARDASSLLAAIYAEPENTAHRLVYADALTERGDPRGEFITLQCTRAPDARPSARERELLKNYGRAWLGPLDSGIRKQGLVYRRGFPAEARECASEEQQRDPAWATLEALELDVLTWGERAVTFLDRGELRALERLWLRAEDAALLRTPKPKLSVLGLRRATAEFLGTILGSAAFPAVRELELELSGTGFAALAKLPAWKRLTRVRLTGQMIRELPSFAGVVPTLEVIDGGGLSDDHNGWCLRFSGARLERLHLSCSDRKPSGWWPARALSTLPAPMLVEVTADENVKLDDPTLAPALARLRG